MDKNNLDPKIIEDIHHMGERLEQTGRTLKKTGVVIVTLIIIGCSGIAHNLITQKKQNELFKTVMAAEDYDLDGIANVFDVDDDNDTVPDEFDSYPFNKDIGNEDENANKTPDWKEIDQDNDQINDYRDIE